MSNLTMAATAMVINQQEEIAGLRAEVERLEGDIQSTRVHYLALAEEVERLKAENYRLKEYAAKVAEGDH